MSRMLPKLGTVKVDKKKLMVRCVVDVSDEIKEEIERHREVVESGYRAQLQWIERMRREMVKIPTIDPHPKTEAKNLDARVGDVWMDSCGMAWPVDNTQGGIASADRVWRMDGRSKSGDYMDWLTDRLWCRPKDLRSDKLAVMIAEEYVKTYESHWCRDKASEQAQAMDNCARVYFGPGEYTSSAAVNVTLEPKPKKSTRKTPWCELVELRRAPDTHFFATQKKHGAWQTEASDNFRRRAEDELFERARRMVQARFLSWPRCCDQDGRIDVSDHGDELRAMLFCPSCRKVIPWPRERQLPGS